jgi:hypothetical protein
MYVKHLAKSIPNQDDQYKTLLEEMVPIAEQVAEKLNLQ